MLSNFGIKGFFFKLAAQILHFTHQLLRRSEYLQAQMQNDLENFSHLKCHQYVWKAKVFRHPLDQSLVYSLAHCLET